MKRILLPLLAALEWSLVCQAALQPGKKDFDRTLLTNHQPMLVSHRSAPARQQAPKQGVTATLNYEKLKNMASPRSGHLMFPSGNGFVVVGGNGSASAELYENGQFRPLTISAPHTEGFVVSLGNGRYMVGGSDVSAGSESLAKKTDIWNPTTKTFAAGPDMTTGRHGCNAISIADGKAFVSGNYFGEDKVMDYYDGTTFKGVGNMDARYSPYLFYSSEGYVVSMSYFNADMDIMELYTFSDGSKSLLADCYDLATGETKYVATPYDEEIMPSLLPSGMLSSDYHFTHNGQNFYMILAGMVDETQPEGFLYVLLYYNAEENKTYIFDKFQIPMQHPVSGETITYRGGVIVNQQKQEAYLIGWSGDDTNQTLHVVSFNYTTNDWTIASATGFNHDMTDTAAWTLLSDGRLACTGGITGGQGASNEAYIFTPPVAGQGSDDTPAAAGTTLMVYTKDGTVTTFELKDKPKAKFEGKNLHIVSSKADVTYALSDVVRFTYVRSAVGIQERDADNETEISYQKEDGTLVLSQMPANATVAVYGLNGKLLKKLTTTHAGTFRLNLSMLPQGVYIVKAGTITYKLMKR
jgi:hypothetical protein